MRQTIVKGRVSYEPNSIGAGCPMQRPWEQGGFVSYPEPMSGEKVRVRSVTFADHFSQPGLFWRSQAKWEQDHIVDAFCFELAKVTVVTVRERMVSNLTQVDTALAQRVADGLGMKLPAPPPGAANLPRTNKPAQDAALSMDPSPKESIVGRKVAVLVADGADSAAIGTMRRALEAGGASMKLIAPRLGEIKSGDGKMLKIDHSLPTVSSVLFDAIYVPGGKRNAEMLCADANAILFIKEAYKHGKAIAASDEGLMLINKSASSAGAVNGEYQGPGVTLASAKKVNGAFAKEFVSAIASHRFPTRPDLKNIVA